MSELKTLKDIEIKNTWVLEPINFRGKVWKQGNSLMITVPSHIIKEYGLEAGVHLDILGKLVTPSEVKNKDRIVKQRFISHDLFTDLRQEAIKMRKELKKKEQGLHVQGQIDFIDYFFNITEEDLK